MGTPLVGAVWAPARRHDTADGHAWEIAYNPFWTIQKDGRVSMKKD
jgi:hypothetical protein